MSRPVFVSIGVRRIYGATMFIGGRSVAITDEPVVIHLPGGLSYCAVLPEPLRSAYRRQRLADIGVREIFEESHS